MATLAFAEAVDIGYNRGRLSAPAAASLRRVDADMRDAFGRVLDVNEAWRSPEDADRNYAAYQAWVRYQNGGPAAPWAPIALPGDKSVHCFGEAVDSDDGYDARAVAILNDHGWYQTVYRWVNGVWTLVETWHFEYQWWRDNHRNDTATSGSVPFDPATLLEASMSNPIVNVVSKYGEPAGNGTLWIAKNDGTFERYEAPYDPNPRGVVGKVFYAGAAEPPTINQRDFQTVQRFWKTMCKTA